jgi:hypothetical protein
MTYGLTGCEDVDAPRCAIALEDEEEIQKCGDVDEDWEERHLELRSGKRTHSAALLGSNHEGS